MSTGLPEAKEATLVSAQQAANKANQCRHNNKLINTKKGGCLPHCPDVDLFVNNHFAFALVTINRAGRLAAALQKGET